MSNLHDVATGPWHLVSRFFRSLPDTPPAVGDEVWVDRHLTPGERTLWTQMSNQDRRHSIGVARRFVERRPSANRAEIAGALLHDVGKIESQLGTFERAVATLVGPRTERFARYHDHEEIGAERLSALDSDPVTVALVGGHGPAYDDLAAVDY